MAPQKWRNRLMSLDVITLLLGCQLLGEVLVRLTDIPVPGPVVGMALLFLGLVFRGLVLKTHLPESVKRTAGGLLQHLSLLFVPAGVGVMVHLPRLADEWMPITAGVVVSTLLTIVVTGVLMQALLRRSAARSSDPASED
ncbi:CidA/LrgA family protein [Caenispirillum salinarum]|uniref:CidA/LrgA family protein n=1 Tax=Caenispirillum salinarum TaxID=859058 RepID=UPI00384E50DF